MVSCGESDLSPTKSSTQKAQAESKGETFNFEYRIYEKPLKVGPSFSSKVNLSESPLKTVLSELSLLNTAKDIKEFIVTSSSPKEKELDLIKLFKNNKFKTVSDYKNFIFSNFSHFEIYGEISYKDIVIVVTELISSEGDPVTQGFVIKKHEEQYLTVFEGNLNIPFASKMSQDNYSVILRKNIPVDKEAVPTFGHRSWAQN